VVEELTLLPSTSMVNVPDGVVVIDADCGATVMVMVPFAPEASELSAAVSVVVVAASEDALVAGHALIRLYKSTEPRPDASS
jgi:hypothetical protein